MPANDSAPPISTPDDPYANIADWYDVEHDGFAADGEFYQAVIASAAGARINALEIGSGTGRLAAALALAGWAVTGIEPSAAMRARCATRLAKLPPAVARRLHIVAGTATAPNLPTPPSGGAFDAAIIALGTFAHLTTAKERKEALAVIRPQLRPNGKLVIDLDLEGPRSLAEHPKKPVRLGVWPLPSKATPTHSTQPAPQQRLTHIATGLPGPTPGTVIIHHGYVVSEGKRQISQATATTTLALLTYEQVAEELRQAGYRISAVYGDYSLAPLAADAPRALIVATR